MKKLMYFLLVTPFFLLQSDSFADDGYNNFLFSAYFKAQKLRVVAMENMEKLEKRINDNKISMVKAENIIRKARERSDAQARQAEQIATEALQKSKAALLKNEQSLNEWKLKKLRAENSLATIRNLMAEKSAGGQKIKGQVSDYSGRVEILRANGEKFTLDRNNPGFMEPGDKVQTWNGTAEVQMLDGRGTAKIGPNSELAMSKDTPEEQMAELVRGKLYMAVDKVDEFAKKIKENIEHYQKDMQEIEGWTEEYLKSLEHKINRRFSIKTPTAILGVRGTTYAIEIKDHKTVEIAVLNGEVEVSSIGGNKAVIVSEGYRVIVTREGIFETQKIEIMEKWWEK